MIGSNKLFAFGVAAGRTGGELLNHVIDACAERGIGPCDVRGEAFVVQPPDPQLQARTAHLFAKGGSLLSGDTPDTMLTLWLPDCSGRAVMDRAWPGASTLLVEESVNIAGPSEGICRIAIVTRNPALRRQEFWDYWNGHHVPLVIRHVPLFFRYVSNLVLDERAPIDGIGEQWFTNRAAVDEHNRLNAEQKPEVSADLPRFLLRRQTLLTHLVAAHVGKQ